ncbi:MAG: isocitrate/isopropylmalate family dehydrogenase [Phycisphaeraceae bacterium]
MAGPEGTLTYGQLVERIAAQHARLMDTGRQPGSRVLNDHPPGSVSWLVMLIASLDLGLQVIQPDQDWPRRDVMRHVAPLLESAPATATAAVPGVWLFTSGTTDHPKPRLRSLALLRSDVTRVRARLPAALVERRPAGLCLLPLSHGFGLINGLLLMHAIGGTVLVENIEHRDAVAELLRTHEVRMLYSWPAQLEILSDRELWRQAKTPLTWCVSSSLRLSAETAARFTAASGCPVRQQYGATETGPLCLDSDEPPSTQTTCMGTPLDGVTLRVLDEAGHELPAQREGELAVRLDHLSLDPSELTVDGFWRTGDRGYVDPSGRVHVLGRLKAFTDERGPASKVIDEKLVASHLSALLDGALPDWQPRTAPDRSCVVGVLPGEGVGPEVIDAALTVLGVLEDHVAPRFTVRTGGPIGVEAKRLTGQSLTEEVTTFCTTVFDEHGAVLCGPGGGRFVYDLRARFDLYCKLIPLRPCHQLGDVSVLRPGHADGVDVLVVRENTGGLYFGSWDIQRNGDGHAIASQHCQYREHEIERILEVGFRAARQRRGHLTVVTKPGGVPAISQLWTEKLHEMNGRYHLAVRVLEVDNAAYQLIADPRAFDVVVCSNMFGDVLGDCGSLLLGGRGMSYSGNFASPNRAVYQTGHGAAWDLAGTDRANPLGQIYALAMMLRESFALPDAAAAIERAIARTLARGIRTADIAGPGHQCVGTRQMAQHVGQALVDVLAGKDI